MLRSTCRSHNCYHAKEPAAHLQAMQGKASGSKIQGTQSSQVRAAAKAADEERKEETQTGKKSPSTATHAQRPKAKTLVPRQHGSRNIR